MPASPSAIVPGRPPTSRRPAAAARSLAGSKARAIHAWADPRQAGAIRGSAYWRLEARDLLQLPVRDRHPRAQPHVLRPRIDDVALDEQAFFGKIAEHAPAGSPVAPARWPHLAHDPQERVAVGLVDPVLDLNQHGAIVGPRLNRDDHVRQPRGRQGVLVLAQAHADAPADREQEQQRAGRRAAPRACGSTMRPRPRPRFPRPDWPGPQGSSSTPRGRAPTPARRSAHRRPGSRERPPTPHPRRMRRPPRRR